VARASPVGKKELGGGRTLIGEGLHRDEEIDTEDE